MQTLFRNSFMNWVTKRPMKEKTVWYCDEFVSLDTETSHCTINGKEYTWITSIQVLFNDQYYLFRKPSELINFYLDLYKDLNIDDHHRLVTIIHNASYDLAYLLPYFQRYLPFPDDRSGIYDGKHKIKQYRQGGLEFRDTYILSGVSLAKWCEDLNTEHKKKIGFYDYSKILYQDSVLNEAEQEYDKYDVLALHDCYKKQMQIEGDNVATVPNTGTGYVRRIFRKASIQDKQYRNKYFLGNALELEQYKMCINSYAGGYTHNNRFLKGKTLKGCIIGHRDFRSHYPSQMRVSPLPFGKVELAYDKMITPNKKWEIKDVLDLWPNYSSISTILIKNVCLKNDKITMPFMQRSKMRINNVNNIVCDNGRVITFNGEAIMDVDNHTLYILNEQYKMNYQIVKVLTFENEYMPPVLAAVIDYYFKKKADLKKEVKRCEKQYGELAEETINAKINLQRCKAMLNGIYGMFATNPVTDDMDINFNATNPEEIFNLHRVITDEEMEDKLNRYYGSRNSFLPYQVGVFVTALARRELYEFIKVIGYDKVLYCDTDSIFYRKSEEVEEKIKKLNEEKEANAERLHAYIITDEGKKIYYDYFDQEEDLKKFRGLHSKCYGGITLNNEFVATIAGVPARTLIGMKDNKPIYKTREQELKNINNIKDGFLFKICTGTTCKYDIHEPEIIEINGHIIETAGGAIIDILPTKEIKDLDDIDWYDETTYDDTFIP